MKKTLIAILFVTLFIGIVFIPAGASQNDEIQPRGFVRNRWFLASITGRVLVENFSYDKHFEKLNIFTNIEITGTVLDMDYGMPWRTSDFYIGNWARYHYDSGDRITINANILLRSLNNTIAVGEEFWFSDQYINFFHENECLGLFVKIKQIE